MITKDYIRKNLNKKTKICKIQVEVAWNKTSTSSIYNAVERAFVKEDREFSDLLHVVSTEPISFNEKTKAFVLEVELDTQDVDWNE